MRRPVRRTVVYVLHANRCVVWWSNTSACDERLEALLDSAERTRLSRLLRPEDRARFAVGAAMLRLVVAEETGIPAEQVVIDRRCTDCGQLHGRPNLPG